MYRAIKVLERDAAHEEDSKKSHHCRQPPSPVGHPGRDSATVISYYYFDALQLEPSPFEEFEKSEKGVESGGYPLQSARRMNSFDFSLVEEQDPSVGLNPPLTPKQREALHK